MQNTRRKDLIGKTPWYLHNNCRLCSRHFEPSQFANKMQKRLKWNAVPTLFDIPNPPRPINTGRRPRKRAVEAGASESVAKHRKGEYRKWLNWFSIYKFQMIVHGITCISVFVLKCTTLQCRYQWKVTPRYWFNFRFFWSALKSTIKSTKVLEYMYRNHINIMPFYWAVCLFGWMMDFYESKTISRHGGKVDF